MAIIDGRKIAQEVLAELTTQINSKSLSLCLAAIIIGDDPALQKFVELKKKAADQVAIRFASHVLLEDISEQAVKDLIAQLSQDRNTHGIFIELPVPRQFNTQQLLDAIDPVKDVDVLSKVQEDLFYAGKGEILPPAVLALKIVLEKQEITPKDKKVAVFGQGRLIGKPISHWLESQGAQVFRIDEHTPDSAVHSREADIIVTGVGKPGLITKEMIKEGAIVIDFGYGRKEDQMVGDVALNEVSQKVSLITPVPGGMGPVVIAAVLKNLVQLAEGNA